MGAPRPPLLQAGQELRAAVRRSGLPPRAPRPAAGDLSALTIALVAVAAVAVFAVAAYTVGRETIRLSRVPSRRVVDLADAAEWVADHLPEDLASRLSHGDVERLVTWYAEYLRIHGLTGTTTEPLRPGAAERAAVVGGHDSLAYVIGKADAARLGIDDVDIDRVLTVMGDYLVHVGAVGTRIDPGAPPGDAPDSSPDSSPDPSPDVPPDPGPG